MSCDQCQVVTVSGTPIHEQGCPNNWKHAVTGEPYATSCWQCGGDFTPDEKPNKYSVCSGCLTKRSNERTTRELYAPQGVIQLYYLTLVLVDVGIKTGVAECLSIRLPHARCGLLLLVTGLKPTLRNAGLPGVWCSLLIPCEHLDFPW